MIRLLLRTLKRPGFGAGGEWALTGDTELAAKYKNQHV
jgi:hypothetical protein